MGLDDVLRGYFKKDISYSIFSVLLVIFGVSVILKILYNPFCDIIPYWIELVPELETYLGLISSLLIVGILITEYVLK
ncbi:hypothetical protein [Methanococcus sp. CF]